MLELIRRHKGIFSIIFVLACAGLIVSMFGSPGGGGGGGTSPFMGSEVIASVEGQDVQTRELVQRLNQEMQRMEGFMQTQLENAKSPEQERMMRQIMMQQVSARNILQRLIYQNFAYSTALDLGIYASPESIRNEIKKYPQFQKDGRFDPLLYKQMVSRPALFEADLKKQVAIDTLRKAFEFGLRPVSKGEVSDQAWLNRSFTFETFEISADNIKAAKNPTAQQLEAFEKEADSPARLQAYYNKNISKYRQDEQVRANHILVKTGSKKNLSDIIKEIKDGTISFEDAAKKYSEDASNAGKGGDLGFFKKGMMVPEFEKVAFSLKNKGDLSGIVKTQFGEHVIQFVEKKAASERTLEDVKAEILPEAWKETQTTDKLQELLSSWTELAKGPSAKALKKYDLKWTAAQPWKPSSTFFPPVGDVETHLPDLLSMSKEKSFIGKAIQKGNAYVFVRLSKVEEAPDESVTVADTKVSQAYEFYFKQRYDQAEKAKRINIKEDKLAQIQSAIQQQTR